MRYQVRYHSSKIININLVYGDTLALSEEMQDRFDSQCIFLHVFLWRNAGTQF